MFIDMKNILLDEHDVPKLSNFFYSLSIPEDETDVEAYEGIWDLWFSSPEFKESGKVTEKVMYIISVNFF